MKIFNKSLILSIVFLIIFVGTASFIILDPFDDLNSVKVVLANRSIEINEVIESDDIYTVSYPKELYTPGMLKHPSEVIGKVAVTKIDQNGFFTEEKLDIAFLRPTEDHHFFVIPNQWILQLQGSLRRFDKVNVIAVKSGSDKEFPLPILSEPVLKNIPVVYVKSNNNREVEDVAGVTDRLQGTTRPTQIELSLILEEFKELEKLFDQGYKFIFSY